MYRTWGKIIALLCLVIFLTSCEGAAEGIRFAGGAYAFVFTNSLEKDSELTVVDAQGKPRSSIRLAKMGIFDIVPDHRGNWILPEKFGDTLTYVKADGSLAEEKSLLFPLYVQEDKKMRISTYNTALHYGTLEIKKGKEKKRIQLDGLLVAADRDEKKVYVFSAIPQSKSFRVIVVDAESGKTEKVIPVPTSLPHTFRVMDGKLWMTDPDRPKVWLLDLQTDQIDKIEVSGTDTCWVLDDSSFFYVVSRSQPDQITVLDRKTLKKKHILKLQLRDKQFVALKMRVDKKHFYLLQQLENGSGLFTVFDKQTGRRLQSFQIQAPRKTLIQNFALLKQND